MLCHHLPCRTVNTVCTPLIHSGEEEVQYFRLVTNTSSCVSQLVTSEKHIVEVTPSISVHSNILLLTSVNASYVSPPKLEKMLTTVFLSSTAPVEALPVPPTKGHKN